MIDIYRMNKEQTIQMIEQLRTEVGWGKRDLLKMVREWNREYWPRGLDDELKDIIKRGKIEQLFWHLVEKAPFKIELDNLDDDEGGVMVYCNSKILAVHDQSVAGSHWECAPDMPVAYACAGDHPNLVKELEDEGYIVNDDNYCSPDEEEEVTACPLV